MPNFFMSEKLQPIFFIKDRDNSKMLRETLEAGKIDQGLMPILENLFSLPITSCESCYGHPEKGSDPYFSYVEDAPQNEQDERFQRLFKEKITELNITINKRIGRDIVRIFFTEDDHGGGPKEYTFRFKIVDKKSFKENGRKILEIIWSEFSKYLSGLN